jgi:hypothetical protein
MFFSYDHEDGIAFHKTAEEAEARALEAFRYDEDKASEGWHVGAKSVRL